MSVLTYELIRINRDDEAQWFVGHIESFGGVKSQGISVRDAADDMVTEVGKFKLGARIALDGNDREGWYIEVREP